MISDDWSAPLYLDRPIREGDGQRAVLMSELLLAVTEDNQLVPRVARDVPGVGVSVQISLLALAQVTDLHVAVIVDQGGQSGVCTEARLRSDQSQPEWATLHSHWSRSVVAVL